MIGLTELIFLCLLLLMGICIINYLVGIIKKSVIEYSHGYAEGIKTK